MDIYIDMYYIMFLNFDSINIFFFTVNPSFSPFSFAALNLFSLSSVAMQNCLKDIQAINVHVGLNWAKQAAWCADRLFSSNISAKSPLWHPVLKSWSTFPMQCPAQWLCSPQLDPTALPLQSNCLAASGLMTRSSGLTSFMGKYFNFSHGKNCHLAQVLTSLHICQNNLLENFFFLVSKVRTRSLFSLFFPKTYI